MRRPIVLTLYCEKSCPVLERSSIRIFTSPFAAVGMGALTACRIASGRVPSRRACGIWSGGSTRVA